MIPLYADQVMSATGCAKDTADGWLPFLQGTCKAYEITNQKRIAAFLAQIGHESAGLVRLEENLNYTWQALRRVWPKRFPTDEIAQQYHRRPFAIANRAYANRMGNGNEASGDGWKYRGKGLIQLTGKDNHRACGEAIGEDLVSNPEKLLQPVNAALSAGWFWKVNGLNELADRGDILRISTKINGGALGLEDRLAKYEKALIAFA